MKLAGSQLILILLSVVNLQANLDEHGGTMPSAATIAPVSHAEIS
tara:strand:- start:852 stop:986 length:135 start_codon:yes stop_codon:yes gene_type:complete